MADKTLTCKDCGDSFTFSERDQEFFASKGFTEPRRCKPCRIKKKREKERE